MASENVVIEALRNSMTRTEKAAWSIQELAKEARDAGNNGEAVRLHGKLEGIRLVVSFIDEEMTLAEKNEQDEQ